MIDKIKIYKNRKYNIIRNGNITDRINGFINEVDLLICMVFSYFYANGMFLSVRELISDTISLSSIILGILGVLIGMLIGLREDSPFFIKAKTKEKDIFFFNVLVSELRDGFILNMFFVVYTLFFKLLPPNSFYLAKMVFITFWVFLFIKIIWQVIYLIIIISKIIIYEEPDNKSREKIT